MSGLLQLFTNNAISLLEVSISSSDTTIVLQPGQGSNFPQPVNPGEFFLITLEDINAPLQREIISISQRAGDVLTVLQRGIENTVPRNWAAINTLVDHRITADTIKRAFLSPEVPPPSSGTGGVEYNPVLVEPAWSLGVAKVEYSELRRGNKFWVSMVSLANGLAQSFEVLTIVQGNIAANTETVTWTRSNRIGYNFKGTLDVTLNPATNEMTLSWLNSESFIDVTVTVVRI